MRQRKKGNQWHFGMAHIGGDADSGLVHSVRGTAGNVNDVVEGNSLLHGQKVAFGDAGYQGVDKRPDAKTHVRWHVWRCVRDCADRWSQHPTRRMH